MRRGLLGQIATPGSGHRVLSGVDWCADNAAFTGGYPGDEKYLAWLSARRQHAGRCAFATAPDVVGDAAATLARSLPMLERIRAAGYPVALVAQDGLENLSISFDSFDVLFLGGTTAWKLGPAAADLAGEARARGLGVHCGRSTASHGCATPRRSAATRSMAPSWLTGPTATCRSCCAGWRRSTPRIRRCPAPRAPPQPAPRRPPARRRLRQRPTGGTPPSTAPRRSTPPAPRSPFLGQEFVLTSGDPTP